MGIDIIVKVLGVLKDWPILFPDQWKPMCWGSFTDKN